MSQAPFTYQQATDICEDFEDLIGTRLKISNEQYFSIRDVVTCPFEEVDRLAFLNDFVAINEKDLSSYNLTGKDFNVFIFAVNPTDDADYIFIPIEDYIHGQGIQYNFPE